MRQLLIILSLCFNSLSFAQAAPIDDIEMRAREVGHALRCVVCQNQSIEESDASLAADMRTLVRARLEQGDTNAEVIDFMQERYGDFVLLEPPVQPNTYPLWAGPFILLGLGLLWFVIQSRRSSEKDA